MNLMDVVQTGSGVDLFSVPYVFFVSLSIFCVSMYSLCLYVFFVPLCIFCVVLCIFVFYVLFVL